VRTLKAFGVGLRSVDEAICSDKFWGSIKIMLPIAMVQREAVRWVNSILIWKKKCGLWRTPQMVGETWCTGVRSEDKGRCGPSHERLPFGETTSADHLCYEIELLD
jgi:hypothetical protein